SSGTLLIDLPNPNSHKPGTKNGGISLGEQSFVIFDGSAGTIQIDDTLVMNNNQVLVGSGVSIHVKGERFGLPATYTTPQTRPRLLGADDDVDTIVLPLERGAVIGLDLVGGRNGITGDGASDALITLNRISGANYVEGELSGNGIYLKNLADGFVITSNVLEGNDRAGLYVEGSFPVGISYNTLRENGTGMHFSTDVEGSITENTIEENRQYGIRVFGDVHGDIANNTIIENEQTGIMVAETVFGSIRNNQAMKNGRHAIHVEGDVLGEVRDNILEDNHYYGVLIGGDVGGDILRNIATDNGGGLSVGGDVMGNIKDNQALENNGDALRTNGDVFGSVMSNSVLGNGGDGIKLLGTVHGSIALNTSSENDGDGIHAEMGIKGDVINNTTLSNGSNGIEVWPFIGGQVAHNDAHHNGKNGIEVVNVAGDIIRNRVNDNGRKRYSTGASGLSIAGGFGGEVAENEARNNYSEGILLIVQPQEQVIARDNLLVGNNRMRHEFMVEKWGNSSGPVFVTLIDNTSRNDLGGGTGYDYRHELYSEIRLIDGGGNFGLIEP
ncbi:MAG: right-handed parallel beta-helix repeat-containing protein, partial [Planctomycetaceae bacterium]|nr:right-handed parallel beta-helix repeat-containing protein [Planctomycetaceae bacterium]